MPNQTIAKVILPLADIPEGATITKLTGHKPYLVKETLKIHGLSPESHQADTITATGVRFLLCPASGSINAHSDRLEVVWHVGAEERRALVEALGLTSDDVSDWGAAT